jgi:hypothetical protein
MSDCHWLYIQRGGVTWVGRTYIEVERIPDTLSDRVLDGPCSGPQVSSAGLLMVGNAVLHLSADEVEARDKTRLLEEP